MRLLVTISNLISRIRHHPQRLAVSIWLARKQASTRRQGEIDYDSSATRFFEMDEAHVIFPGREMISSISLPFHTLSHTLTLTLSQLKDSLAHGKGISRLTDLIYRETER